MSECVVCGSSVSVSDACVHCGTPVCETHRDPSAHDCPGVESDSDRWYTNPDVGRADTESSATGGTDRSNPRRVAVGVLAVVAVALAGTAVLAATTAPLTFDESRAESRIVAETNEVRSERGLEPLAGDASLAQVARAHSADMARQDYVDHVAPNGSTPVDRLQRFGIECYAAENIYYTEQGGLLVTEGTYAERTVEEWLDSPAHRETLLDADASRQGIGLVRANGHIYVTQLVC